MRFFNLFPQDTAGEERFSGLSSFYCRGASAAIVAYDITQKHSIQVLRDRHLQLLEAAEPHCLVVMVGTKRDLVTPMTRDVPETVGRKLAIEQNLKKGRTEESLSQIPFFETSAKTGQNVEKVFDLILNTCLPLDDKEVARNYTRKSTGLVLEEFPRKDAKKSGNCC